jgi:hypothetical protein
MISALDPASASSTRFIALRLSSIHCAAASSAFCVDEPGISSDRKTSSSGILSVVSVASKRCQTCSLTPDSISFTPAACSLCAPYGEPEDTTTISTSLVGLPWLITGTAVSEMNSNSPATSTILADME